MPIANYGVLRARPIARRLGAGQNPHYQIHCVAPNPNPQRPQPEHFRIAVNVKSRQSPSNCSISSSNASASLTEFLETLPQGRRELPRWV
jgi:uncharacterized protein YukJ